MLQNLVEKLKKLGSREGAEGGSIDFEINEPVIVNVYDMYWTNGYTNNLGVGIYHSGVQVYNREYTYGGHPSDTSGIFTIEPRNSEELGENFKLKTSIPLGSTHLSQEEIDEVMVNLGQKFTGKDYHLTRQNCNHFSNSMLAIICNSALPNWVNRLATVSTTVPFIERAIPKEWLRPQDCSELDDEY